MKPGVLATEPKRQVRASKCPRVLAPPVGATSTLTRGQPSAPAASFPNTRQRRGPHRFLKSHLLFQIVSFRNLKKTRPAILKLNGIWVLDCPRRPRPLRSATWASRPLAESPRRWLREARSGAASNKLRRGVDAGDRSPGRAGSGAPSG